MPHPSTALFSAVLMALLRIGNDMSDHATLPGCVLKRRRKVRAVAYISRVARRVPLRYMYQVPSTRKQGNTTPEVERLHQQFNSQEKDGKGDQGYDRCQVDRQKRPVERLSAGRSAGTRYWVEAAGSEEDQIIVPYLGLIEG